MLLAVLRRPFARSKQVFARPPSGLHSRHNRALLPKSNRIAAGCLAKKPEILRRGSARFPAAGKCLAPSDFCLPTTKSGRAPRVSKRPLVNVPLVTVQGRLDKHQRRRNISRKSEPLVETPSLPAADFPQSAREAQLDRTSSANRAPLSNATCRARPNLSAGPIGWPACVTHRYNDAKVRLRRTAANLFGEEHFFDSQA